MERLRVAMNVLRERLGRERAPTRDRRLIEELREIVERCAVPVLDARTADAILDYDDDGLPDSTTVQ